MNEMTNRIGAGLLFSRTTGETSRAVTS